jgi:hypothetical protein
MLACPVRRVVRRMPVVRHQRLPEVLEHATNAARNHDVSMQVVKSMCIECGRGSWRTYEAMVTFKERLRSVCFENVASVDYVAKSDCGSDWS